VRLRLLRLLVTHLWPRLTRVRAMPTPAGQALSQGPVSTPASQALRQPPLPTPASQEAARRLRTTLRRQHAFLQPVRTEKSETAAAQHVVNVGEQPAAYVS